MITEPKFHYEQVTTVDQHQGTITKLYSGTCIPQTVTPNSRSSLNFWDGSLTHVFCHSWGCTLKHMCCSYWSWTLKHTFLNYCTWAMKPKFHIWFPCTLERTHRHIELELYSLHPGIIEATLQGMCSVTTDLELWSKYPTCLLLFATSNFAFWSMHSTIVEHTL